MSEDFYVDAYFDDAAWYACEYPERPYEEGVTLWCGEPCTGCLVSATVQLNKVNPLEISAAEHDHWDHIIATLSDQPDMPWLDAR